MSRAALLLCLFGVLLHILLSDPLLDALGIHYSGEEGAFYEKIHPGTYVIFLSFALLLWRRGNPLSQAWRLYRKEPVFMILLAVYGVLLGYVVARSGPHGMAFFLDTHMTVPICALVLCRLPPIWCSRALAGFVLLAMCNSAIGLYESLSHTRLFAFDPQWIVLHEAYFRASALRGHPLNNAMFTAVALFITLALPYSLWWKTVCSMIYFASLVAFGGRAALLFSAFGVLLLLAAHTHKRLHARQLTLMQCFGIVSVALFAPLTMLLGLYLLIHSALGGRIAAQSLGGASTHSRLLALQLFDYMRPSEIWFGASSQRILDIVERMNQFMPLSDIENPWLLMFMYLGIVTFPFWLAATCAFIYRLVKRQPLALQLAVFAYIAVASTSNSFGRKDSTYLIMTSAAVACARLLAARRQEA